MNQEQVKFLVNLQKELKTQENDWQASPRYWAVKDYKKEIGNEDYHNGEISYFHNDGDAVEFENLKELKEFLYDYEFHEADDCLAELLEDDETDFETLWDYLENTDSDFESLFMTEVAFIVPNTFFITKEECKRHIEANRHHYTSKAHTYAMTAWRSPQVERLWELLETADFEKILKEENKAVP